MIPLDPLSVLALIVTGLLLFLAGWRMGAASRRRASEIDRAEQDAEWAEHVSPWRERRPF